jgi:pimeloyl-ACP methyl ester carboxylesterase
MKRRTFVRGALALPTGLLMGCSALQQQASSAFNFAPRRLLDVNGIQLAVYEKGEGIPIIFCHGFPELAYSWRHQMAAVAQAGFRAIAPDLRGFGLSSSPAAVSEYVATEVCDDLVAMMQALDIEKAVFCGHDWGGFIVDTMNLLYPERVSGLINIGAGHHFRPPGLPDFENNTAEVLDKQAYNDFMQQPDVPERVLNGDPQALFKALFRNKYFSTAVIGSLPADAALRRVDLVAMMQDSAHATDLFVGDETLSSYVGAYLHSGFRGGVNWYRAMEQSWQSIFQRPVNWKVEVPYLYLWPDDDPINVMGLAVGLDDYIPHLEKQVIAGGNHFVLEQQSMNCL